VIRFYCCDVIAGVDHHSDHRTFRLPTEYEMEQFKDDPLDFIRLDVLLCGSGTGETADVTSRRGCPPGAGKQRVRERDRGESGGGLGLGWFSIMRNRNADDALKTKDSAVYSLTAVATRGSTTQVGWGVSLIWFCRGLIMSFVFLVAWGDEHKCAR
jgi:hypothetical protein